MEWQIAGSDDTNADGRSDVLWWNPDTRSLSLWLTLTRAITEPVMTQVNGDGCMTESWSPAGLGRLSAGPLPDLLGYGGNGGLVYWAMSWTNGAFDCQARGDLRVPVGGSLAAVGDFDADGFEDVLRQEMDDPAFADPQLRAYFIRARDVIAASPLRFENADVSGRHYEDRHFSGPR